MKWRLVIALYEINDSNISFLGKGKHISTDNFALWLVVLVARGDEDG